MRRNDVLVWGTAVSESRWDTGVIVKDEREYAAVSEPTTGQNLWTQTHKVSGV